MIRTYYWHDRIINRAHYWLRTVGNLNPHRYFLIGNAGDIFANEIIEHKYQTKAVNIADEGKRLLVIGSIGHKLLPGDIVCGVGCKTEDLPKSIPGKESLIYGLRGPLSYEAFRKAGYDVSQVKFLLDPGLLIRYFVDMQKQAEKNKIGFIPHYRERAFYWKNRPRNVTLINIDSSPTNIANEILACELIYSSSLHGLIFSHSLGRPCVFVAPRTAEPLFKYKDYFASINLNMPKPIAELKSHMHISKPLSPANISFEKNDIDLPAASLLREKGILVDNHTY